MSGYHSSTVGHRKFQQRAARRHDDFRGPVARGVVARAARGFGLVDDRDLGKQMDPLPQAEKTERHDALLAVEPEVLEIPAGVAEIRAAKHHRAGDECVDRARRGGVELRVPVVLAIADAEGERGEFGARGEIFDGAGHVVRSGEAAVVVVEDDELAGGGSHEEIARRGQGDGPRGLDRLHLRIRFEQPAVDFVGRRIVHDENFDPRIGLREAALDAQPERFAPLPRDEGHGHERRFGGTIRRKLEAKGA